MRGYPSSFCKRLLHSEGWIPTKNFSRSNVNLLTNLSISDRRNGDAKSAREAFDEVPKRDVIAWSALISRYSRQGHSREAVNEFVLMNRRGVDANQFTYGSVLRACTHLDFACVVDLLARSGCIKEAYEFVCNMPIRPTASLWGSLLGACIMHQDAVVGERASRHLIAMEPGWSLSYLVKEPRLLEQLAFGYLDHWN